MFIKRIAISLLLLLIVAAVLNAQTSQNKSNVPLNSTDSCRICAFPKFFQNRGLPKSDLLLDLKLKNEYILYNCLSVNREIIDIEGNNEQGLHVKFMKDGKCTDTTFLITDVSDLRLGNIGSSGQPLILPIRPARYFACQQGTLDINASFLEITGILGYGGSYTNDLDRNVGFSNIYYGLEALINPFGDFLGEKTSLAIGGGGFFEGGRLRLPVMMQLRWRFLGDQKVSESFEFVPNHCQFASPGEKPISPSDDADMSDASCKEITKGYPEMDSTVYYLRQKKIMTDPFRPFIFVEGGLIFNGFTEGAGKEPSINPEDYGQYLGGAGIGLPLGDSFTLSLSYRFLRLNLRTICETCNNYYVLNTNEVHSVLLKAGYRVNW